MSGDGEGGLPSEIGEENEDFPSKITKGEGGAPSEIGEENEEFPSKIGKGERGAPSEPGEENEDLPSKIAKREGGLPSETGESGDGEGGLPSEEIGGTEADPLVAVYRHDVHKLRGREHTAAHDEWYGVRVNEDVPLGADRDAAVLSRPRGEPEQTVSNHASPFRLSLVTGEAMAESDRILAATDGGFRELIQSDDPAELHAAWLTSDVAAAFNESIFYPYSSLKYHVLLAGALLSAYRDGYAFEDLYVAVTPGEAAAETRTAAAARASEAVTSFETVLWSPTLTIDLTAAPGDRPAASLGPAPARSFADVWSRLPAHPFQVDDARLRMVVDAQLRRIRSWSVALQFIEEVSGDGMRRSLAGEGQHVLMAPKNSGSGGETDPTSQSRRSSGSDGGDR